MYTQEPWYMYIEDDEANWPRYWPTIRAGETEIVGTEGFYGESRKQSIENARRVVACVNACIGVPTETLEQWVLSEGFQGVTMNRQESIDPATGPILDDTRGNMGRRLK